MDEASFDLYRRFLPPRLESQPLCAEADGALGAAVRHPPGPQEVDDVDATRAVSEATLISFASQSSLRASMECALAKEGNGVAFAISSAVLEPPR